MPNDYRRRGYNPMQLYLWGVIDDSRMLTVTNTAVSGQLYTPYIDERAYAVPPKQLWRLGSSNIYLGYRSPVDNGGVDGQAGAFESTAIPGLANYTGRVLVYRWEHEYFQFIIPDMSALISGIAPGETKTYVGYTITVTAVSQGARTRTCGMVVTRTTGWRGLGHADGVARCKRHHRGADAHDHDQGAHDAGADHDHHQGAHDAGADHVHHDNDQGAHHYHAGADNDHHDDFHCVANDFVCLAL